MSRPTGLGQALMVRSENPAHLSLIRLVEEHRADQKAKTLLINPLA
jgi:hypothetical protein